jgi:hypothetical protein
MMLPEETAADRVREFLDNHISAERTGGAISTIQRGRQSSLDLTAADLRILVMQADALRHAAPHAHMAMELLDNTGQTE